MSQINILELAKQGNPDAIALLINRSSKTKGITAKVAFRDGFLQVMLESAQVPDQINLPSLIYRGVKSLEVLHLKKLRVYGKKIGEDNPSWSKNFDFSKQVKTVASQSTLLQVDPLEKVKTTPVYQTSVTTPLRSISKDKTQSYKKEVNPQTVAISEAAIDRENYQRTLGVRRFFGFIMIIGLGTLWTLFNLNQSTPPSNPLAQSSSPSPSSTPLSTPIPQAKPSSSLSSCEKAMETAAAIPSNQDTVEDIDSAIRTCRSMNELISASSKFSAALDGTDEATFVSNRCTYNSSLKNSAICQSLLPTMTTVYYLAINSEAPAPDNPVPVSNKETMQALIIAAQNLDRTNYNSILTSSSVSLIRGGEMVDIVSTSGMLVQVKLRSWDIQGNDLSDQVRWTSSKFVQSRQMQF
jgi:hypothetical protein